MWPGARVAACRTAGAIAHLAGPVLLAGALSACSSFGLLSSGPPPTLDPDATRTQLTRQTDVIGSVKQLAGFPADRPLTTQAEWRQFSHAAFDAADDQCETYLTALRRLEVARRQTTRQISLLGAATVSIMGIAEAAASAIAITGAAFGLAAASVDNIAGGLLYELPASSVRALVESMQDAYEKQLTDQNFANQATTFRAVRGYIALCLPAVIEARASDSVGRAPILATRDSDRPGRPPRVQVSEGATGGAGGTGGASGTRTPAAPVAIQPPSGRAEGGRNADEIAITQANLRRIRERLCLDPDASRSVQAADLQQGIAIWRQSPRADAPPQGPDGTLGSREIAALFSLLPCDRSRFRNVFERSEFASDASVRQLQRLLGMATAARSGRLDEPTRSAIAGRAQGFGLASGPEVTPALLDRLLTPPST